MSNENKNTDPGGAFNIAATVRDIMEESLAARAQDVNGTPVLVDREGNLTILTDLMERPLARSGMSINTRTLADFQTSIALEQLSIGKDWNGRGYCAQAGRGMKFTWILDHADKEDRKLWGESQIVFEPLTSRHFERWNTSDRTWFEQREFADFLEENLDDVVGPTAAALLSISRNLEATVKHKITSSHRPEIGDATIHYESETDTGDIVIPQEFEIGIPIFQHADPYKVKVGLRLRVREGQCRFQYRMLNVDEAIEDIFNDWKEHLIHIYGLDFVVADRARG